MRAMDKGAKSRSRAMNPGVKSRSRAMSNGKFTPCANCPNPSACRAAGKCLGPSKAMKK